MEIRAPLHLTMSGNNKLLSIPSIAICGSRRPNQQELAVARDYAQAAAKHNITIVSGNAEGIDLAVHFSTPKAEGKTILVLPTGMDSFQIKNEYKEVLDWDNVLIISQFETNDPFKEFRALARNQLICALSHISVEMDPVQN